MPHGQAPSLLGLIAFGGFDDMAGLDFCECDLGHFDWQSQGGTGKVTDFQPPGRPFEVAGRAVTARIGGGSRGQRIGQMHS